MCMFVPLVVVDKVDKIDYDPHTWVSLAQMHEKEGMMLKAVKRNKEKEERLNIHTYNNYYYY